MTDRLPRITAGEIIKVLLKLKGKGIFMRIAIACIFCLLVINFSVCFANGTEHPYIPKDGYVPDKITAMRIAEAVWIPIYGEEQIQKEKPFKARLENDVWIVEGSFPGGSKGGVAYAKISKKTGCILEVTHGK